MNKERVYLDFQNGSGLRPEVRRAIEEALSMVGNPSSLHAEARLAGRLIDEARSRVASLIGAQPNEIFFTSSGTEANAGALLGLAKANEGKGKPLAGAQGRHLIASAVEHLSILHQVRRMEKEGWQVTILPVDRTGRVDPEFLEKALTPETVLVLIQWANAEVGTIQPIQELVRRVKAHGVLFHSDAIAAVGQIPVEVKNVPVAALSLAANTLGGPPGVGALFVRKGVRILPWFVGGGQEDGRRAGTENLLGIVGMGEAARIAQEEKQEISARLISLRDQLIHGILHSIPGAVLNGHPSERLPRHASFSFPGVDGEALVLDLDLQGIAVGLGSACSHQTLKASHVLTAMGVEESLALGTITLTLGAQTTEEEIERVLQVLPEVVAQQKRCQAELLKT